MADAFNEPPLPPAGEGPGGRPVTAPRHSTAATLRRRLAEAFARRASACHGETRSVLDARLAALQAGTGTPPACEGDRVAPALPTTAQRSPLAALVHELQRRPRLLDSGAQRPAATGQATRDTDSGHADPAALLDYFRETWTRIRADREWRQSLQRVPDHAGPLNSDHLVHRSLSLMRDVSPEYLQQFLSHLDSLARLEQMSAAEAKAAREKRRGTTAARKQAAGKARRDTA